MMKSKLVSIVIPVYNVEDYLKRCIESVIQQTYKNLEIIIVDDGATDDSPIICDEYASKDERIKVIHKINGGLSDARNVGYSESRGEYIFFLDSDDWLEKNTIEILYEALLRYDADIVVANYYYQYEFHCVSANVIEEVQVYNRKQAMEELLRNDLIKNFAWGKLYKRELLEEYAFPVGKLFEDTYWTHLIFNQAQKIVLVKEELVYYFQRSTSISYVFDIKKLHILDGYKERREFVKKEYPELLYLIDETMISLMINLYMDSIRHFDRKIHKNFKTVLMKLCKELQEEINQNPLIDKEKKSQFNSFYKSTKIYFIKECMKKVRGKLWA
ncbi:hypothetical protein JCM31739_19010 [Faecalimonas canis]